MNVVINQPCYLPWRGYFALIMSADVFVFYDDVQLPQGRSFQTRVQIKTRYGKKWLTVPLIRARKKNQLILEAQIHEQSKWRKKHYRAIQDSLSLCLYWTTYEPMIREWYNYTWNGLADLTIQTTLDIVTSLSRVVRRKDSLKSANVWVLLSISHQQVA